jgi:hypothetical protein
MMPLFFRKIMLGVMCCIGVSVHAQTYLGTSACLFDVKVLQVRNKSVRIKCRVANTGRLDLPGKKSDPAPVIALDTFLLPPVLWGHEASLSEAATGRLPRLKPGQLSDPIWLEVAVAIPPVSDGCADLVVDSLYLGYYGAETLTLQYILKNAGVAPVQVAGGATPLGINVYFTSGNKLTRGAVPAGNDVVLTGRETLTGWLAAGQKMAGKLEIPLKNRSKFMPNLVVELAPPPTLSECDRTNNTKSFLLPF